MPEKKRKIAFVDIDGCLIQHGKINQDLVDRLKAGGYEEIVLFTQRSKFIQFSTITGQYDQRSIEQGIVVTTPDVVQALQRSLGDTPIRVSTSVDQYTEHPATDYYEKELKEFEARLKTHAMGNVSLERAGDDPEPYDYFNQEFRKESEQIREKLKIGPKVAPEKFYPKDKVAQFNHLVASLPDAEYQIDYYDDNYQNQKEIVDARKQDNSQTPGKKVELNCFIVGKVGYSVDYALVSKHYEEIAQSEKDAQLTVRSAREIEGISQLLTQLIERNPTQKMSLRGGLFKGEDFNEKIVAAKCLKLLQGDKVTFTSTELKKIESPHFRAFNELGAIIKLIEVKLDCKFKDMQGDDNQKSFFSRNSRSRGSHSS